MVAPTWLTHRRALLPLGETRRAGAWTAAAVSIARQAVEIGLERREEARSPTCPTTMSVAADRARSWPRCCPPSTTSRRRPRAACVPHEAATERDYRDHAGAIADAAPDLILVEGQRRGVDARVAVAEAAQTGLPVWVALTREALASTELPDWIEWAVAHEVRRLLLPGPLAERAAAFDAPLAWGAVAPSDEPLAAWLEAGAGAIARLDRATTTELEAMRVAIDEHERVSIEARHAARRRWQALLQRAASMAPGGAAAFIGEADDPALPDGFEWVRVEPHELPHLPPGRFRLLVDPERRIGPDAARALEAGGIAVSRPGQTDTLRLMALDDSADPPLAIYRREG